MLNTLWKDWFNAPQQNTLNTSEVKIQNFFSFDFIFIHEHFVDIDFPFCILRLWWWLWSSSPFPAWGHGAPTPSPARRGIPSCCLWSQRLLPSSTGDTALDVFCFKPPIIITAVLTLNEIVTPRNVKFSLISDFYLFTFFSLFVFVKVHSM